MNQLYKVRANCVTLKLFLEDNLHLVRKEQIGGVNSVKINMIIRFKLKVLFRYFC